MVAPNDPLIQDAVSDILWAAEARPGFDLFFVVGNTPAVRNGFWEAVRMQSPSATLLPVAELKGSLLARLRELPKADGPTVIVGLEERLGKGASGYGFLGQMNLDRDAIRRVERNLIILLPAFALVELAQGAPDFYDFRTAVLALSSEQDDEVELPPRKSEPLWAANPEERARWITLVEKREGRTATPTEEVERLVQLGQLTREQGDPRRSEQHLRGALDIAQKHSINVGLGSHLFSELGLTLLDLGRADESLGILLRSEEIVRVHLGNDDPLVALSTNNVGAALEEKGDLVGALTRYREAERIDRTVYGNEHRELATDLGNIGSVLTKQGHLDEALEHQRQAERIDRQALGDDHPQVAVRLTNIGGVLHIKGDIEGALTHYREAERIDRAAFGEEHPQVATDLNNIGGALELMGNLDEALRHFKDSERIDRKVYGSEHPAVARDLGNIGGVLLDQGERDEGLRTLGQALSILLRTTGAKGRKALSYALELEGKGGDPLAVARSIGGERFALELASEIRKVRRKTGATARLPKVELPPLGLNGLRNQA